MVKFLDICLGMNYLYAITCLLIFLSNAFSIHAQERNNEEILYMVEGEVLDSLNDRPLNASIIYESLPYGNEYGILGQTDTTGYFQFPVYDKTKFLVEIRAKGYFSINDTIYHSNVDNTTINLSYRLVRNYNEGNIRLENLHFAQGSAEIPEIAFIELDRLATILLKNENLKIVLEGHTDYRGNKKLNQELSKNRVIAVKEYLVNRGILKRRIKTKAFGGSKPISRSGEKESIKLNRRVEVRIIN